MTVADRIRVGVLGKTGRMGSLVSQTISTAGDLDFVGATDGGQEGLSELLAADPQVVVDFTHPDSVMTHVEFMVQQGVSMVIGTSGVGPDRQAAIEQMLAEAPDVAVLVIPNFALGAVLAMRFTREAARFFRSIEIIELHHAGKADAPSGTAAATVQAVAAARAEAGLGAIPDATTHDPSGARGAVVDGGVHVHSVRLPGLVAHQEAILGNDGELLTIRHDSIDRSSFMPGVLLAVRGALGRPGLTVGLEPLLGL
jgi:4-hydroxy-tetrahydrodipicolinate reductase